MHRQQLRLVSRGNKNQAIARKFWATALSKNEVTHLAHRDKTAPF